MDETHRRLLDAAGLIPDPPGKRLAELAAQTAAQCAAAEQAAYGLAADTAGDKDLNALATILAGASHRLSQVAGRIGERLTPPTTTQEDTDDKPADGPPVPHPHLGGS